MTKEERTQAEKEQGHKMLEYIRAFAILTTALDSTTLSSVHDNLTVELAKNKAVFNLTPHNEQFFNAALDLIEHNLSVKEAT